jgi:hypothetical protein
MNREEYRAALNAAMEYASGSGDDWNDKFLAGLYRNGLCLSELSSWLLIYEYAVQAPTPFRGVDEKTDIDLWPYYTWVIPR